MGGYVEYELSVQGSCRRQAKPITRLIVVGKVNGAITLVPVQVGGVLSVGVIIHQYQGGPKDIGPSQQGSGREFYNSPDILGHVWRSPRSVQTSKERIPADLYCIRDTIPGEPL